MEPSEETQLDLEESLPAAEERGQNAPKKKEGIFDRLDALFFSHQKEAWFALWNFFLTAGTLMVDTDIQTGERAIPTHTEGIMGFFEQNMAGANEVLVIFYLARIPVELLARAIEVLVDEDIDPRIKVGVSSLLAVIVSSALELIEKPSGASLHGGVPDPLDALGNVAAGIYAAGGYLVIDYLFKPHKTPIFNKWREKIAETNSPSNEEAHEHHLD